jgi:hypothetical protein
VVNATPRPLYPQETDYYQNVKSYGAGILTVLSNRIGDVALLIVIA